MTLCPHVTRAPGERFWAGTVVDASIVAAWLSPDEDGSAAQSVLERVSAGEALTAPWLFWAELRNILIANERLGRLADSAVTAFLATLRDLPIALDTSPVEAQVLEISRKHQLSVYDALYLELALRFTIPLASLDRRLMAGAMAEDAA